MRGENCRCSTMPWISTSTLWICNFQFTSAVIKKNQRLNFTGVRNGRSEVFDLTKNIYKTCHGRRHCAYYSEEIYYHTWTMGKEMYILIYKYVDVRQTWTRAKAKEYSEWRPTENSVMAVREIIIYMNIKKTKSYDNHRYANCVKLQWEITSAV